jgi:glycosyltransferase involved in cell wall biosynthesis
MNLLHIIPRFIGGGPERHLLALASAWRTSGFQVRQRFVVLDPPASAPLLIKARRLGIELLIAPDPATLRSAIAAADIVEIRFWNHPGLYELLRHDLPPARRLLSSAVAGTTLPQVLTAEIGGIADAMILSTEASRQTPAVAEAQARGCRIESIPSLADMSRLAGFNPRPHDGIRVGYLGLVEPTKMHPRFAELSSAVKTKGVQFDIYGGGTWQEHVQRPFDEAGMSDRVRFHGQVEDIRTAFAEMDIFGYPLAPDTSATSEKAIQEAMWVGIPPVVLAGTGASPMVRHEITGLICESESDYPRAIERLAEDAELRRRLGEAAREFAREHFDPDRNAARFRHLFEFLHELPKREALPLPGLDEPGAQQFVRSLGSLGVDFEASFRGIPTSSATTLAAAERSIRQSSPVMTQGEGGIVHYRNTYPQDPHLHLWCGLISLHAQNHPAAQREFDDAIRCGLDPGRVQPHLANSSDAR